MAVWGIYDKENHKFTRYYSLYYDPDSNTTKDGWQLFKYDTELEAIIDHQERFRGHSTYEVMELPADEPEWIF